MNNTIRQIEENHKRNESRKFFSEIKKLRQQNTRLPYMYKVENNIVITQMGQILNRWKDHFCTILNLDTDASLDKHRKQLTLTDNQSDIEIPAQTYNEVCSIINKLKCNKMGGTDNIIPEPIKYGRRTLRQ